MPNDTSEHEKDCQCSRCLAERIFNANDTHELPEDFDDRLNDLHRAVCTRNDKRKRDRMKRSKSYRLIKDLPGVKPGAYIHEDGLEIRVLDHDGYVSYQVKPGDHPNWFKPVGEYVKSKGWDRVTFTERETE